MTDGKSRRRDAEENRDRILRAARTLLARQPAASMDDLAQAAGVVRRTVYAHFPSRDELLAGLADKCAADLLDALARTDRSTLSPEIALADFALTMWSAGEQYRLLITLAESNLGRAGLRDLLQPIGEQSAALLERGRASGRFATHLPLPVLRVAMQAVILAMMQAVNDGMWADEGPRAAVAVLVAAGVPLAGAEEATRRASDVSQNIAQG